MRVSEIFMRLAVAAVVIVGAADTTVGNTCAALPVSGNGVAVMQNESGQSVLSEESGVLEQEKEQGGVLGVRRNPDGTIVGPVDEVIDTTKTEKGVL